MHVISKYLNINHIIIVLINYLIIICENCVSKVSVIIILALTVKLTMNP